MTVARQKDGPLVAFSKPEIEQSIPARFEQKVLEYSSCLAVKMDGNQVTYSELNRANKCIGDKLLQLGNHRQEPVAILKIRCGSERPVDSRRSWYSEVGKNLCTD